MLISLSSLSYSLTLSSFLLLSILFSLTLSFLSLLLSSLLLSLFSLSLLSLHSLSLDAIGYRLGTLVGDKRSGIRFVLQRPKKLAELCERKTMMMLLAIQVGDGGL